MDFRCYLCKFRMSDGIPPLDALSTTQMMGVGADEIEQVGQRMKTRILDGTRFEGMSSGSFCAFCITAITQYPSMAIGNSGHEMRWTTNAYDFCNGKYVDIVWAAVICETCDDLELHRNSIDTTKGESFSLFSDCLRARAGILHHVQMLYPNAELADLKELMFTEA